jgi:hypothetical protein
MTTRVIHNQEPTRCLVGTVQLSTQPPDGDSCIYPIFGIDYRGYQDQGKVDEILELLNEQTWIILDVNGSKFVVSTPPLQGFQWRVEFSTTDNNRDRFFAQLLRQGMWILCCISQAKILKTIVGKGCQINRSKIVPANQEALELFDRISKGKEAE